MREIKFRAWCEGSHENMTFQKPHMDYSFPVVSGKFASTEGCEIYGTYESIPLMQFTGLKDKNGKEIYEGDIIEDESGHRWDMKWEQGSMEPFGHYYDFPNESWKIIGNIYENPNLLKND